MWPHGTVEILHVWKLGFEGGKYFHHSVRVLKDFTKVFHLKRDTWSVYFECFLSSSDSRLAFTEVPQNSKFKWPVRSQFAERHIHLCNQSYLFEIAFFVIISERSTSRTMSFVCPICQKSFSTNSNRTKHVVLIHKVCRSNRRNSIFSICPDLISFISLQKSGRFKCKNCDKRFCNEFNLKSHEIIHTVRWSLFSLVGCLPDVGCTYLFWTNPLSSLREKSHLVASFAKNDSTGRKF